MTDLFLGQSYDPDTDTFTFDTVSGRYVGVPIGTTDREGEKNPTVYQVTAPDGSVIGWYREAPMVGALVMHAIEGAVGDFSEEYNYSTHRDRDGFRLI